MLAMHGYSLRKGSSITMVHVGEDVKTPRRSHVDDV